MYWGHDCTSMLWCGQLAAVRDSARGCVCRADCSAAMDDFLQDLSYVSGQYNERGSYEALHARLLEKVCPPSPFLPASLLHSEQHRTPVIHCSIACR